MSNEMTAPVSSLMLHENFDKSFCCPVCLCCKLRMVYGLCQHKVCMDCLYCQEGHRRKALSRCPVCMKENVFPQEKPDIPKDNIMVMYHLGVRECSYSHCNEQFWHWEIKEHERKHEVPQVNKKTSTNAVNDNESSKMEKVSRKMKTRGKMTKSCTIYRRKLRSSIS